MNTAINVSSIQETGKKYIEAVNAYLNKNIDQADLINAQEEFEDVLKEVNQHDLIKALASSTRKIQEELSNLLSLADNIEDYNLQKAINNIQKALEEIGEISELKYVTRNK